MRTTADIVRDNHVQIVTLSEVDKPQYVLLKKLFGKNYKSFPVHYEGGKYKPSARSIFYKTKDESGKPLWQAEKSGMLKVPDYSDRRLKNPTRGFPWVQLVHAQTGQQLVVLSVHTVAWNEARGYTDSDGAIKREESGRLIAAWAADMKQRFPDAVVLVTGDINQPDHLRRNRDKVLKGNRSRIIPCIVGKELRAIDDIAANRAGQCPQSTRHIDQAFTNAEEVQDVRYIDKNQSDHPGLYYWLKLFPKAR